MPPARSAAAVVRQIRLWTGLVLFTYLTTHFLNHARGGGRVAAHREAR